MTTPDDLSRASMVDRYLKVILLAQEEFRDDRYVPIGRVAVATGVSVIAARAIVKSLVEAGLLVHERYGGVRLLPRGLQRAAKILRRQRLLELFLVRALRMDWADVQVEADRLEHAVSQRVIDRIDDVLGHPTVDPHGDPIPDRNGNLVTHDSGTLLTCALNKPVVVTRVTDQDPAFLRFVASNKLKPGAILQVEARDEVAGTVRIARNEQIVTIGARAAAKLEVDERAHPGPK